MSGKSKSIKMVLLKVSEEALNERGITLDEFLVMFLMKRRVDVRTTIQTLLLKGIGLSNPQDDAVLFLSSNQERMIDEILSDSECEPAKVKRNFKGLAERLREVFPEGKKSGTNLYWRDSVSIVTKRLEKWFNKYPNSFSDDEIVDAAKRYVESFNGQYTYMQVLPYFIFKNVPVNGMMEEKSQLLSVLENKETATGDSWTTELR